MKSRIRLLVSSLVLGLASFSATFAADDGTITVAPTTEPKTSEPAKAHDGKRVQGALDQRLRQLDETLQLTSDQKQKIKNIWAKQLEEVKDLSPEERRAKGKEALKATRAEVRAVLTPEQQTKFDAMKPERHGHKGKGNKAE
jgi:Spy/CpxP family protein refolding chaperone